MLVSKPITVRSHLVLLVIATTVPLLVFSTILIRQEIKNQHEAVGRGLRDTVRALSSASDREIATARSVLEALAESQYLDSSDFRAFHQLSSAAAAKFEGVRIILFALDGQQLTNTMRHYGTPLPNPLRDAESAGRHADYPDLPLGGFGALREVIRTQRPVISDMFIALSSRRPSVAINIPVMRRGKLVYVLDITFGPEVFGKLLNEQRMPPGSFAAVFDSKGIIIARSIESEKFVGRLGAPSLLTRVARSNEWSGSGRVLEGDPVYTAVVRSKATGWITAVGVLQAVVDAEINRSFIFLAGGGTLLLLLSLTAALLIGRKLANPITALAKSAEAIQRGDPVAIRPSVLEIEALQSALIATGTAARAGAKQQEQRLIAEAREAELTRLNELSSRLWGMRTLQQGLDEMLVATIELVGADTGNVQIFDADRGVLVMAAQRGFQQEFLDFFKEIAADHDSVCGRALRSRERMIIEDIEVDPAYAPFRSVARTAGYRAVQSTPLIGSDGAPLGVLSTHFRAPHRPTAHELSRLDLYARQAVNFIERCTSEEALRLTEQNLRRELEAARRLHQVSTRLGDSGALYEEILDSAMAIMHSDYASIQMFHPERGDGELRLLGYRGFNAYAAKFWEWVGLDSKSTCGVALRTGERVFVTDVRKCAFLAGSDDLQTYLDTGISAVQTTPLISRGGGVTLGMISTHWREPHEANANDLRLLDVLARLAADLLERKRAEEVLLNYAAQLKEADRRKDEFLATLSHELRNPLAPIRNAVEIMKNIGPLESKLQWCRDLIDEQVSLMARLMEDLLDLSRITRDKLVLRKQRIELADVIHRAVEISRPQIETARHKLIVDLPEKQIILDGDSARLTQVFANLLNNAAKYMEDHGEIRLSGGLSRETQSEQVIISIKDRGVGIAPEALPQVFNMFFQAESGERHEGLGIGLTLARRLIEMHGGTIEVKSEGLGKGSEFVVRLPVLEIEPRSTFLQSAVSKRNSAEISVETAAAPTNHASAEWYRGHKITSQPLYDPTQNCWTASIAILWRSDEDWHEHRIDGVKPFESDNEAVEEGLMIARCWIDEKL